MVVLTVSKSLVVVGYLFKVVFLKVESSAAFCSSYNNLTGTTKYSFEVKMGIIIRFK